jgi:hypothetical protein
MTRIPGFHAAVSLTKSTNTLMSSFGGCDDPVGRCFNVCCGDTCYLYCCGPYQAFVAVCFRGQPLGFCSDCIPV